MLAKTARCVSAAAAKLPVTFCLKYIKYYVFCLKQDKYHEVVRQNDFYVNK